MNTFEQMTDRGHELVVFHQDPETGLRAIAAVHSTVLGPGFGGCRRWCYATESDALFDVLRLSEGMTYKAAAANVAIGGGKAVIMLPKRGHAATEAEARAMGRFVQRLAGQYISAEDVGLSPQYVDWMAAETQWVTGGETACDGGDPSPHTALGVVNAMKAALRYTGKPADFGGITVAIQGCGNVGRNVGRILHEHGAKLIVSDIDDAAVAHMVEAYGAEAVRPDMILSAECDILAPCALGGIISGNTIQTLHAPIVCGGANNVLADYDEDGVALQAAGIVYVPDFIANAGGMIELACNYLGMPEAERLSRIADIETTSLTILKEAESQPSSYAAAVAYAKRKIAEHARATQIAG